MLQSELDASPAELELLLLEGLESGNAVAVTPEFWKDLWNRVDSRRNSKQDLD
jgi:hypothetical protein